MAAKLLGDEAVVRVREVPRSRARLLFGSDALCQSFRISRRGWSKISTTLVTQRVLPKRLPVVANGRVWLKDHANV